MINKVVSILLVLALTGAALSPAIIAQTKQEKKAAEVKAKLQKLGTGETVIVKVKLITGTEYQGYVSQANAADFVVVDQSGFANTVNYSDVKSNGGKNLSTKAKNGNRVGTGTGRSAPIPPLILHALGKKNLQLKNRSLLLQLSEIKQRSSSR